MIVQTYLERVPCEGCLPPLSRFLSQNKTDQDPFLNCRSLRAENIQLESLHQRLTLAVLPINWCELGTPVSLQLRFCEHRHLLWWSNIRRSSWCTHNAHRKLVETRCGTDSKFEICPHIQQHLLVFRQFEAKRDFVCSTWIDLTSDWKLNRIKTDHFFKRKWSLPLSGSS